MPSWPAKDPDAVLDYLYTIPLDEGDSVSAYTFTKLSGDVVVDSHSRSGANVTVWLSGGTEGETAVFEVTWSTVGGRDDDDHITIAIADDAPVLVLTGYAKPSPPDLIARYPAFAAVGVNAMQLWLTDAERMVDTSWLEGDYAVGLMSLAAHNMALAGLGVAGATLGSLPAGLTRMKSGSLELTFADSVAAAQAGGGYDATRYGREFAILLRRNKGGPRVMPTGAWPVPPGIGWTRGQG